MLRGRVGDVGKSLVTAGKGGPCWVMVANGG